MSRRRGGNAGTGGSKPLAKNIFNGASRDDLIEALDDKDHSISCLRCVKHTHGHTLECWEAFKQQTHWSIGQWKYEKEEKKKVEDSFQKHRDTLITAGIFVPKLKPGTAADVAL